ncbi:YjjG family noncanonical pyrimidine nucleotidase [Fructobacillus sp. M1-13]|uniref:Noncanonical pyrimidine nucleotidase, YjjG family n=1 Tax=Fructobacillus papyriferae TaxID=2713171 RepID=A0ABS5QQD1_9LACO|nr:YjjG family noncanonical pyrimidine nucleotidase [Fructobacillus papyriferae]MBS9334700.1 noncanonical pyrimidine nucleotidase, YjjG family [Fructobacillus papyriferae]MCD2158690.1 YjjG family noncanonical pyrimidine nucleotidase [Fructobacillus papyriferae]
MAINTLIFDLDDTLLDFRGGESQDIKMLLGKHLGLKGKKQDQALAVYQKINKGLWSAYEQGAINQQDIFRRRFQETLAALQQTGQADPQEIEREYAFLRDHNYRILKGAKELLQSLAGHYTLFAGTNGQEETQIRRLRETGLFEYFDAVFTSQGLNVAKPDPDFFDQIFAAHPAMKREETLMIGDGLQSDIRGGQNARIQTVWVNLRDQVLPDDLKPTKIVFSLKELQEYLA